MSRITAAAMLTAIEEAFLVNQISVTDRQIIIKDMSAILDGMEDNSEVSIFSAGGVLTVKNITYRRYYNDGQLFSEEWFDYKGQHHRDDYKPAIKYYYPRSGAVLEQEHWRVHSSELREEDKPTRITYHENGKVASEGWLRIKEAKTRQREYLFITYDKLGNVESKRIAHASRG